MLCRRPVLAQPNKQTDVTAWLKRTKQLTYSGMRPGVTDRGYRDKGSSPQPFEAAPSPFE